MSISTTYIMHKEGQSTRVNVKMNRNIYQDYINIIKTDKYKGNY